MLSGLALRTQSPDLTERVEKTKLIRFLGAFCRERAVKQQGRGRLYTRRGPGWRGFGADSKNEQQVPRPEIDDRTCFGAESWVSRQEDKIVAPSAASLLG